MTYYLQTRVFNGITIAAVSALTLFALSGCTPLIPNYVRPSPGIEAIFPTTAQSVNKGTRDASPWR